MSILDKFSIIENHVTKSNTDCIKKLENYFDNYINTHTKVIIPDYIKQLVWFNKFDIKIIYESVKSILQNFLMQRRANIRISIKKDSFTLTSLNVFINNFLDKLEYLNHILNNSDIVNFGIDQLSNIIVFDSIIVIFIEKEIIDFNPDNLKNIQTLITIVKSFNSTKSLTIDVLTIKNEIFESNKIKPIKKSCKCKHIANKPKILVQNNSYYNNLLKIFSNIYKKNYINDQDSPLPIHIKRINKLNESINYCYNIKHYYKFLENEDDNEKLSQPLIEVIIENLFLILRNNSVKEIELVFNNIYKSLNNLIFDKLDSSYINSKQICNEFLGLIDKINKNNNEDILIFIDLICKINILNDYSIKTVLYKKLATIIETNQLLINKIIDKISQNIINNIDNNNDNIIIFMSTCKNTDIFLTKYYQKLIERLLNQFTKKNISKYIKYEKDLAYKLSLYFSSNIIHKINKVINDIEISYNNNFFDNLIVACTSPSYWDINQNEGIINNNMINNMPNTILSYYMKQYSNIYSTFYNDKRVLNWFPHFGEVNITYLNKKLKMLPIHFMVLELFTNVNSLTLETVQKSIFFKNYSPKFINDVIFSLVLSNVLKVKDNIIILETEIKNNNFKSNIIEIFFSTSDYASIYEEKRAHELANSREDILKANINSIIKKQSMNKNNLLQLLIKQITVFEVTDDLLNKVLIEMIKMDYIELKDDMYSKLFY
jgi:hypothetical protein